MGSGDKKSALPPLIDFGEEDSASAPSTGIRQPFDYTQSSPLWDPSSGFELPALSPAGSSSSPFHFEHWEEPQVVAESSSSLSFIDHWDQTPLAYNGGDVTRSSGSGSCPSSKSFTYTHNDISAASVPYPEIDLLSSPDASSCRLSDANSSPGLSSLSWQTPPGNRLPLQDSHSMLLHTPLMHEMPSSKVTSLPKDFSGSLEQVSPDSPFSVSQLTKDSSPYTSQGANSSEGFWLGPFSHPSEEKMTELTQLRSSINGLNFREEATDLLEDADLQAALGSVKPTTEDGWQPSHQGLFEEQPAVHEVNGYIWSSQHSAVSEGQVLPQYNNLGSQSKDVNHVQAKQGRGQEKAARFQDTCGTKVCRMREFISAGGGKGVFKAPVRGGEDGPVAFELRPQPLTEMVNQPTRVLACTDTALWLGCDQGIIVWDIPSALMSSCDGKGNTKGDEDAATYSKLVHELCPLCLFTDTANHLMWSGHKDGKIRAWALSSNHDGETAGDQNAPALAWQAHQTPVLAIVVTSYGELWTGSESGSLRVWPHSVITEAFSMSKESMHIAAALVATSYIDLRARGMASGASSLATIDVRFLIAEHSQCRVWSGGSNLLALWDARTKDVLRVFGPNADAEFTSPNVSPIHEAGKGEEAKLNMTKVLKKEKSQGALSFFQRSRNAVFGAADAVLRAAVGQSIDDSKRMEALVSAADGNVWVGFANGRLAQWDSSGNWLADHRHSPAAVRCLYAFGNRIFVGYADGVVHALAMSSGKLLGAWRAHKSSVARLGVCNNHLFTVADSGGVRGWFVTSPSTFDKVLYLRMTSKEGTYLRQEKFKILAGTWNVGQEKASFKSLMSWLEKGSIEGSIIAIGLQEVEMGAGALAMAAAKETVGLAGSVNGQWWLDSIGDVLNETKPFVRIGSRQLAGLLIGVWVTKEILPYVGGVDVGAVACGFGRAFGNKGAVAVKMMVFRRTVCIINCHFAAHMDGVAKRNADFHHIYHRMSFGRSLRGVTTMAASAVQIIRGNMPSLEQHDDFSEKDNESGDVSANMPELSEADLLIWLGDFNYRLVDLSYAEAVDLAYDKNWEDLIKKDQLRLEMKSGNVFQGMREAYIMFQPTYKFDKGSIELGYDSSEKRRIPAWCDRVLYRDSFDSCEVDRKLGLSRPVAVSPSWYEACMMAVESDHKPVSCLLNVQVAVINEAARRLEYGKFLWTDPEALMIQKQIDIVPETVVQTNNVVLVKKRKSILKISNECTDKMALFSIHLEGEPIGSLLPNHMDEREHAPSILCSGLPVWLQVLPASGVIHPKQTVEITVQYADREVSLEDELSSKGEDSRHSKMEILIVNVKGVMSSTSNQHHVRLSHSSTFGDQRDDHGRYSQRTINHR